MPTIEFYGFTGGARKQMEGVVRKCLADEDFRADCVFVSAGQCQVYDWDGSERPFVRVSTRSAERAERFKILLREKCDLEIIQIEFQPMRAQAGNG